MSTASPTTMDSPSSLSKGDPPKITKEKRTLSSSAWQDLFKNAVQDDDDLWKEYLEVAAEFDARIVDDWTKIIDVILVYVALFSGVLTAFIIETSQQFERDPAEVGNDILVALYAKIADPSSPTVDLQQFFTLDPQKRSNAVYRNSLLYTSLAISVVVTALAASAKLWIIRYNREVSAEGPPHTRAMKRQEAYRGALAWKLEAVIESMPVLALISVLLFGIFIHSAVSEEQGTLGYGVGVILLLGFAFVLVASCSAAFVNNSPFKSSFSDSVNIMFKVFPDYVVRYNSTTIYFRSVGIILFSVGVLVATAYLVIQNSAVFQILAFLSVAGVFALMRKPTKQLDKPRRMYDLPIWTSFSVIIIFGMFALAAYFSPRTAIYLIIFSIASVLLGIQGFVGIHMSETTPDTTQAEAIAWMLQASSSQSPEWFRKAGEIAGKSNNLRALLLEELVPLLTPLITSIHGDGKQQLSPEQHIYVACLATLADFKETKGSWLRNQAALRHPPLSTALRMKLLGLQRAECPHERGRDRALCPYQQGECPYRRVREAASVVLDKAWGSGEEGGADGERDEKGDAEYEEPTNMA